MGGIEMKKAENIQPGHLVSTAFVSSRRDPVQQKCIPATLRAWHGALALAFVLVSCLTIQIAGKGTETRQVAQAAGDIEPVAAGMPLSEAVQLIMNQATGRGLGIGQFDNSVCSLTGDPTANINLRCDNLVHPYAETGIAVDPRNPDHLLAGANDYHLAADGEAATLLSTIGFFVSFDGGTTWTVGRLPGSGGGAADPAPAFDSKFGTTHMAHIRIECPVSGCTFDAEVSTSLDGGLNWGNPAIVANGEGRNTDPSQFAIINDKPWLVADNNPSSPFYGRLYLTWSRFMFKKARNIGSPIFLAYSDDGGRKWTQGVEISGSDATHCTFTLDGRGNRCADNQFSTPVVLPDGSVVVHFANVDNTAAWESPFELDSQTMVVRSSDGGRTWASPVHITDLEDGLFGTDYPVDVFGLATQTGHQLKTWSVQGMTVDPVTGNLYAFWTDNRDGIHDSAMPVTQTNVFMTKSTDGGASWVGPTRVTSGPGDRWMAWGGAYNDAVRVMFLDGSYDFPNRTLYGVTLASSSDGGGTWNFERLDTAPSNPNNAFWFAAHASGCDRCSYFIGDYQGMAMDSLGRAHVVWTDMRRDIGNPPRKASDIEYARR